MAIIRQITNSDTPARSGAIIELKSSELTILQNVLYAYSKDYTTCDEQKQLENVIRTAKEISQYGYSNACNYEEEEEELI